MDSSRLEAQAGLPSNHSNGIANPQTRGSSITNTLRVNPVSSWRNIIQNFSPLWFAICMNTGILAIIMYLLPYQFNGLPVLSTIMYLLDLTLFVIFTLMLLLRWILYPKFAISKTAGQLDEISFYGAPPIAFLTLTALTGLIVSNAYWGGHAWSLVAYVMWWFGMAWMLIATFVAVITIFRTEVTDDRHMTPSLLLPVVGTATAAVVGALICNYSYDISPRLAVPVIIMSYFLGGFAIWVAIILYGLYFHRLMAVGWPEPAKRPTLLMTVGPFGQTSAAMVQLAYAAQTKGAFAGYHRGTFLTSSAASGVSSASIVFGLLLLGHDFFWLFIALAGLLEGAFKRQLSYSLNWWTTIFPVATMANAFLALSVAMDSPTFRVLTTAFLLILLVNYFINWGFTIWYCITGDLLVKREQQERSNEKLA